MFFKSTKPEQKKSPPVNTMSMNQTTVQYPFKPSSIPTSKGVTSGQNLQGTNLIQQYFKWQIQNPVQDSDPTIATIYQITSVPNQKKRFIAIQSFTTFLLNYGGTDFPTALLLCCDQIVGYQTSTGNPTNTISISAPFQISTVLNPGGIIGYNVIYKVDTDVIWDITHVNTLTFRLKIEGDNNYRPLPSAQPILVAGKLSRVVF